ncbi:TetR/AcrR family transcriptional regulator [Candidatus Uabimicrobium sp. HlEnr_7]|uniref:TetR/AcrR family transcriptional regulator n=1 Tax=Candidatus Uabimicrobium helgolandensis TaxID=3095367 RepID=UPI0035588CD3
MKKSQETKERLLKVATSLIWQSSYDSVGVNEICKKAGVTKGGFYYHFETKADLFYECSLHYWKNMKNDYDCIFSPVNSPLEQLEGLILFVLDHQQPQEKNPVSGCPFVTSGALCGNLNEKIRKAAEEISQNIIKYHIVLLRSIKAEKLANSDYDELQTARILYQFIQGVLIVGRVYRSLDMVKKDLREGVYKIVDLKQCHRKS